MRNLYISILFIISVANINAQLKEYKKEVIQANEMLDFENYNKASLIYDELLKSYPDDEFIQFKAAECFLFSEGRIKQCIELLEKAILKYPIKDKNSIEAIEARFYLGQAYHLNYEFNKAKEIFEDLIKKIPPKKNEAIVKIEREMQYCKNAIDLKKQPVKFNISNLGPLINTEYDEHSPVVNIHEDLLLFTSNRETEVTLKYENILKQEHIYFSLWRDKQWITSRAMEINTNENNATIGISPNGETLLIYRNDGSIGNIYISEMKNDKWGEIKKLPSPINTMANETHASFSMDGNTLFFSSDRSGGFGGKDIYSVTKLPNGEWGKVRNLGSEINTEFDEESPYIHPKGDLLYFSSEGHMSMGGYDIFKAKKDSANKWTSVKNIGYPINTPFDDIFYAPTLDEQRVYYASKRDEGFGGTDIYLIEFTDNHPNSLVAIAGFLYKPDESPAIDAKITVTEKKSKEKVGIYRPSPNNGKYIFIIPGGKEYTMEIEMDGHKTILKDFKVSSGKAFARRKLTSYLDPIILKQN